MTIDLDHDGFEVGDGAEDQTTESGIAVALNDIGAALRHQGTRISELELERERLQVVAENARAEVAARLAQCVAEKDGAAVAEARLSEVARELELSRPAFEARTNEAQELRAELAAARRELAAIHRTRLLRWSAKPRRVWGRIRRLLGLRPGFPG